MTWQEHLILIPWFIFFSTGMAALLVDVYRHYKMCKKNSAWKDSCLGPGPVIKKRVET